MDTVVDTMDLEVVDFGAAVVPAIPAVKPIREAKRRALEILDTQSSQKLKRKGKRNLKMVQTLTYDYSRNDTKDVPILINLPSVSRKQREASTDASSLEFFDLLVLPPEVQMGILLEMIPFYTVVKLSVVCKQLKELLEDDHLWKMINDKHFGSASFVGLTWKSSVIKKTRLYLERFPGSSFNNQFFINNKADVLSWAARQGHSALLNKVHTLTSLDINGWYLQRESNLEASPLFLAAQQGHVDMCKRLIEMGASVEAAAVDDSTTPLYVAAFNGHAHVIDLFLRHGVNANVRRKDLSTPLIIAVRKGHTKAIATLLEHGADVSLERRDGVSALYVSAWKGDEKITEMLLKDGKADPNKTSTAERIPAIFAAAYSKHHKTVETLLAYGADINQRNGEGATAASIASFNGDLKTLEVLKKNNADFNLQRNDGTSPLTAAVHGQKLNSIDFLIRCGVNVNAVRADGATPLFIAAQKGLLECAEALIKANANIDLARFDAVTPINAAAQSGHSNIVKLLIEKGAQVNLRENQGITPLCIASQQGHTETIRLLLTGSDEKGEKADPNITTNDQTSPLYLAAQQGHSQVVRLLLDHGANPNLARLNREAPIHACAFRGHSDIVDMLLKAQANPNATRDDGITPLLLAVHSGKTRDLINLIDAGAELNPVRMNDGSTPLLYAASFGFKRKSAILTLIVFGADPHIARKDGFTSVSLLGDKWHVLVEKATTLTKEMICEMVDRQLTNNN